MKEGGHPFPFSQVASNTQDRRHRPGSTENRDRAQPWGRQRWGLSPAMGRWPRRGREASAQGRPPGGASSCPSRDAPLQGRLLLHGRDLKAVMSAPSLDRQPLPAGELHIFWQL